jgi:D-alanine-D-alanine ligase
MPINKTAPENIPVVLIYNIDPEWKKEEKEEAKIVSEKLGKALRGVGHPTEFVSIENENIADKLSSFNPDDWIVFNWCESIPGILHSEWMVAEKLERLGFTFTGADARTLRLSQDKHRVKNILKEDGIPTPQWVLLERPGAASWKIFPAIVKPVYEHCSEGIDAASVVFSEAEAQIRAGAIIEKYRQPVLLEDFIDGREFRVAILGNDTLEVLPVAEMEFSYFKDIKERLCGYDAKFVPESEHYEKIRTLLPAPLRAEELNTLSNICRRAYRVTGCRDYARMDVRLRKGIFYVLDVNPNADLSFDASLACAAETAGISYGEMGSRIVRLAAKRHRAYRGIQ